MCLPITHPVPASHFERRYSLIAQAVSLLQEALYLECDCAGSCDICQSVAHLVLSGRTTLGLCEVIRARQLDQADEDAAEAA